MAEGFSNTVFTLPSGGVVDIDRPDFSICKDADDLMELKYALSEKIIDIELQIDLHEAAFSTGKPNGPNGTTPWDWLPRAKAALKWAKLYRDEAQNRQGRMASLFKARRHADMERAVVEIIKELLPPDKFGAIMDAAEALAAKRVGEMAPETTGQEQDKGKPGNLG